MAKRIKNQHKARPINLPMFFLLYNKMINGIYNITDGI